MFFDKQWKLYSAKHKYSMLAKAAVIEDEVLLSDMDQGLQNSTVFIGDWDQSGIQKRLQQGSFKLNLRLNIAYTIRL